MHYKKIATTAAAFTLTASLATAGSWTLDPAMSNLAFGSIKNDYAGESHSFDEISGGVAEDGTVSIDVALGSVDTLIEIRDERMMKYVFDNAPSASITASLDMAELEGLAVGEAMTKETYGAVNLLGEEVELDATFFVLRLSESKVMAVTDTILMLSTEDAGIDEGITALQEIAGLDSITRVSPITMRLVFDKDM